MLISTEQLKTFVVHARDGEVGNAAGCMLPDERWTVQYLIVDLEPLTDEKKVLVPMASVDHISFNKASLYLRMTVDQIENSPPTDFNEPITRQHEMDLHKYYGWPPYWYEEGATPNAPLQDDPQLPAAETFSETLGDENLPELRDTEEIIGFHVQAADEELGPVEDFIVDETWVVRYIVVNGVNLQNPRPVLISTDWIQSVEWADGHIYLELDSETIEKSPEYDRVIPINRDYEEAIYDYYNQPAYWR